MDEMNNASPLRQSAIMAHEMYTEFKKAGFSKREALELVSRMISGAVSAGLEEGNNSDD